MYEGNGWDEQKKDEASLSAGCDRGDASESAAKGGVAGQTRSMIYCATVARSSY